MISSNCVEAPPGAVLHGDVATMDDFDTLPPRLRHVLNYAPVKPSIDQALELAAKLSEPHVVAVYEHIFAGLWADAGQSPLRP